MSWTRSFRVLAAFLTLLVAACSRSDAPESASLGTVHQADTFTIQTDGWDGEASRTVQAVSIAQTFTAPADPSAKLVRFEIAKLFCSDDAGVFIVPWDDAKATTIGSGTRVQTIAGKGGLASLDTFAPLALTPGGRYAFVIAQVDNHLLTDKNVTIQYGTPKSNFADGGSYHNDTSSNGGGVYGKLLDDGTDLAIVLRFTRDNPSSLTLSQDKETTGYGEPFKVHALLRDTIANADIANALLGFTYPLPGGDTTTTGQTGAKGTVDMTFSAAAAETFTMTVKFGGGGGHGAVTQTISHTVTAGPTTLAITRDIANPVVGDDVTFTATVTPTSGALTPAGTVTFTDDVTGDTADVPLSSGKAAWTEKMTGGNHTFHAEYVPAPLTYAASGNDAVIGIVAKAVTTTTLTSALNPSVVGGNASFQATINSATATGSVHYTISNTPTNIVGDAPVSAGVATFATTALAPGAHVVTASYSGDANFESSVASNLAQTVNKDAVAIAVTDTPVSPSTYPASVTLGYTVSSAGSGGTPTGAYHVMDGATKIADGTLAAGAGTATLTNPAGGTHSLTFTYDGDANHGGSTKTSTHVVNPTASTLTATDPGNSPFDQFFTLNATVSTVGPTAPTGTITFSEDGLTLGSGPAPSADLHIRTLAVGSHVIGVSYTGDASYASTVKTVTHVVVQAATKTTVVPAANPSAVGAPASFTISVAPVNASTFVPSGSVTLLEGATSLGTAALDSSGNAHLDATLALGDHTVHAVYNADPRFAGSTSPDVVQSIALAPTTMTLTSTPNPATAGASVSFTATIPKVNGVAATGSVSFLDGATVLGPRDLVNGVATFATTALTTGTHTIKASYGGDGNYQAGSASIAQGIDAAATTTALVVTPAPAVFGQNVKLTATVTGATGGTVTFKEGGVTIGSAVLDAARTAVVQKDDLAVGSHALSASFVADADHLASTGNTELLVNKADSAIALSSSSNPAATGAQVTFTATVSAVAPGAGTPSGTVTFREGAKVLGTAGVGAGGVASVIVSDLAEGTHTITADIPAGASFNASTSNAIAQTISAAAATLNLGATSSHITYGADVVLDAVVTDPAGLKGEVAFTEGATALCSGAPDAMGHVTCIAPALHAGTHAITATYGTSTATTTVVIDKAATTLTLSSSPNPAAVGQAIAFTVQVAGSARGEVEAFNGTTSLGTTILDTDGSASFTTNDLPAGTYAISVHYAGDDDHLEATSNVVSQVVSVASSDGDAGTDAGPGTGTDAGPGNGSSTSSSSSSSGGSLPPPTADAGGASGGLGAIPVGTPDGGDDGCSTSGPGAGGSAFVGLAMVLAGVASRRRRRR